MDGAWVLVLVAATGIDFGWQAGDDGSLEYIIQLDSGALEGMLAGEAVVSEIHPEVHGVRKFRIQVGDQPLPRDAGNFVPSESAPSSQYQPIVVPERTQPVREQLPYAQDSRPTGSHNPNQDWAANATSPPALVDPVVSPANRDPRPASRFSGPRDSSDSTLGRSDHSLIRQPDRSGSVPPEYTRIAPEPEANPVRFDDEYGRRDPQRAGISRSGGARQQEGYANGPDYPSNNRRSESRPRYEDRPQFAGTRYDDLPYDDVGYNDRPSPREMSRPERGYEQTRLEPRERRPPSLRIESPRQPRRDDEALARSRESPMNSLRERGDSRYHPHEDRPREDDLAANTNDERESVPRRRISRAELSGDAPDSAGGTWPTTLLGLFASLAANAYMGWITWSAVHRYRDLVDDVRVERR